MLAIAAPPLTSVPKEGELGMAMRRLAKAFFNEQQSVHKAAPIVSLFEH